MSSSGPKNSGDIPDKALLRLVASDNDRKAFETLVRRWDGRVIAFLAKSSGQFDLASDMRQEVFLRVWRYADTYNEAYAFSTWLYRIAHNVMRTWHKRENGKHGETLNAAHWQIRDNGTAPDEQADLSEIDRRVRAAIARFDPEDRALLLLRLNAELPFREIGDIVGAPGTTVKSRVIKLMEALRKELVDLQSATGSTRT